MDNGNEKSSGITSVKKRKWSLLSGNEAVQLLLRCLCVVQYELSQHLHGKYIEHFLLSRFDVYKVANICNTWMYKYETGAWFVAALWCWLYFDVFGKSFIISHIRGIYDKNTECGICHRPYRKKEKEEENYVLLAFTLPNVNATQYQVSL